MVLGLNVHSIHAVVGGRESADSLKRGGWSAAQKDISRALMMATLTCSAISPCLVVALPQDVLRRPHEVAHNLHLAHCGHERPVLGR